VYKNSHEPKDVVKNWMRSENTIEFLGLWEVLNNPKLEQAVIELFEKKMSDVLLHDDLNYREH